MTYCPFQRPETTQFKIGDHTIPSITFSQHQGFSYFRSTEMISSDEGFSNWKLQAFSTVIYVQAGFIKVEIPGETVVEARRGMWMLISALKHPLRVSIGNGSQFHGLECDLTVWKSLQTDTSNDEGCGTRQNCISCMNRNEALVFSGSQSMHMQVMMGDLSGLNGYNAIERLKVASLSYELLSSTLETDPFLEKPSKNGNEPCLRDQDVYALESVAAFLENNLDSEHSLQSLSRKFYLNEFKLKKGFKARFQTTVFGYLRQKRMEYARKLLNDDKGSVLEIATRVGYTNPSHFSRAFRETFGMNPAEFRKRKLSA